MKDRLSIVSILIFLVFTGYGQGFSSLQDSLLQRIASAQVKSDTFYNEGLYRSQRIYGKNTYEDNSLFYPSLIALTLDGLREKVSGESKEKINLIYEGVKKNAFRYQSRRGRPTFNYWQTAPDIPHPNGPVKYQTDKYKVPDDFDDTSMIALLLDSPEFSSEIREEMVRYTEGRRKKVRTSFKRLKKSEAYGVWFADKWKQEFDLCVMANTLNFVFKNGYVLNEYDSASLEFIRYSISENLHKKHPFVLSPYYTRTSVILYHVARLIQSEPPGILSEIRAKVVADIYQELEEVTLEIHKVVLYTSLLRLGEHPDVIIDTQELKAQAKDFRWFSANFMLAIGSGTFLRKTLNDSKLVPTFYWRCDAYYWTLLYECLVLTNNEAS